MLKKDLPMIQFYDQDFTDLYEESWNIIDKFFHKGNSKNNFEKEFFNYDEEAINQVEACFASFFLVYSNGNYNSNSLLDNFYNKQEKDGAIRGVYSMESGEPVHITSNKEGLLPPLFSFAEFNIYNKVGNRKRLKEVICPLTAYYDWIEAKFKKANGLYSVPLSAAGMDSIARKGAYYPIDFNCQQALNALYVATIGDILNDRDISFKYKKNYFALKTKINDLMWDEKTKFYYDLTKDEKKLKVKSLATYWSLLAEIPSVSKAEHLVKHLKNPKIFGAEHLFPTLALKEENFDPTGGKYCGAVYPHFNFMVIKGLEKYNYYEFAREAVITHLYFVLETLHSDDAKNADYFEAYLPEEVGPAKTKEGFPRRKFFTYLGLSTITLMIENVLGFYISLPKKTVEWVMPILEVMGIENLSLKRNKITIFSTQSNRVGVWEIRLESDKLYYFTINILETGKKKTLAMPSGKCSMLIDKI